MKRKWAILMLLVSLLTTAATLHQQRSATYERYDVELDLQEDGSLWVAETYRIRFEGTFQQGFTEIPLDRLDDVTDVRLWEGEQEYTQDGFGPGSFSLSVEEGSLWVDWEFESTAGAEVRTFTLAYLLVGGLEVYRDRLLLAWDAVPADRSGIPVEAARFAVHLPAPAPSADVALQGAAAQVERPDDATVVVEASEQVPDGTPLTVLLTLPPGLAVAETPDWQRLAGEVDYRWEGFHVDLTVEPDGRLTLVEQHQLRVVDGYLYTGYREMPWRYLDTIGDVEVWEGDRLLDLSEEPGDYRYIFEVQSGYGAEDLTLVEWAVPAVGPGETAAFTLRYTVEGALRILEEGQAGVWTAVFAGRDEPVEQATVRLYLPEGVDPAAVSAGADAATVAVEAGGTLFLTHEGPVDAGEAWDVRFTLPPGATTAQKPAWQRELEEAQAEATRRAQVQLGAVVLGLLILVGGVLAVVLIWFLWGRDRPVTLPTDYLAEPPSDLPPGIVAYLVDEEPTVKGVLADVLHLATLGLISVDLRERDPMVALNWQEQIGKDEVVEVEEGEEMVLAEHERTLFNAVRQALSGAEEKQASLSQVMWAVRGLLQKVYEQMARQTSAFFSLRPSVARQRWRRGSFGLLIAAGALTLLSCCLFSYSWGLAVAAPGIGLGGVGLALLLTSRWMPRRTTKGAEEAERWRAFRRYLENLKQYGDLERAQQILDDDFAYAVALGVESLVLRHAEAMGAQAPLWLVPMPVSVGKAAALAPRVSLGPARGLLRGLFLSPRRLERAVSRPASRPRPKLRPRPVSPATPSLDGMSEQLGGSLDQASASLGKVLDAAGGGLLSVLGAILEHEASGGGRGGYRPRSGGSWRSSSWSSSRRSSRSSSWRPSRSSGSRRSGGGRRGFG